MRNPGGYGVTTYADSGRKDEEDTFTCCHCNALVVLLPQRTAMTEVQSKDPLVAEAAGVPFCISCMKPICRGCNGKPCVPFMKKIDRAEQRALARRSFV